MVNFEFPAYFLFGFLNTAGWPRTIGILRRRKVVSHAVVCGAITELVRIAIALGAKKPNIAIKLLANIFRKRNWSQQSAKEMWAKYDPSEQVSNQPDKPPEEIIANFPMTVPDFTNPEEVQRDLIAWENVSQEAFSAHYHVVFCQGLIWGLSHPDEASAHYETQRQQFLENLPDMLQAGLAVRPPETFEEFANIMEESVNEFQNEIHPFGEIPQELLSIPVIANRLNSRICCEPDK